MYIRDSLHYYLADLDNQIHHMHYYHPNTLHHNHMNHHLDLILYYSCRHKNQYIRPPQSKTKNEMMIERRNRTATGMTVRYGLKVPGQSRCGGYLIRCSCSSCGQLNEVKVFKVLMTV